MNEIKFRAKNLETRQWVCGDLHIQHPRPHIHTAHGVNHPERVLIDPNTVGQFTGLHDWKGKEIYQGDILEFGKWAYEVIFEDACFWISNNDTTMELHTILGQGTCEVVGTIYDNITHPAVRERVKPESVLVEAVRIRSGERNADYGDAVENFRRITEIANAITGLELTPAQCCKVMIAVKLARELHNHKRDNLVDLCGYADILELIETSKPVSDENI